MFPLKKLTHILKTSRTKYDTDLHIFPGPGETETNGFGNIFEPHCFVAETEHCEWFWKTAGGLLAARCFPRPTLNHPTPRFGRLLHTRVPRCCGSHDKTPIKFFLPGGAGRGGAVKIPQDQVGWPAESRPPKGVRVPPGHSTRELGVPAVAGKWKPLRRRSRGRLLRRGELVPRS